MDRIGHQHVGVDGATALLRLPLAEGRTVVLVGEETSLAIVAGLNRVQRYPGKGEVWPSGHRGIFLH